MAAAFVAINDVFGPIYDVSEAEAADPARAAERAEALKTQIFGHNSARVYNLDLCADYRPLSEGKLAQLKQDTARPAASTPCVTTPPMGISPGGRSQSASPRHFRAADDPRLRPFFRS